MKSLRKISMVVVALVMLVSVGKIDFSLVRIIVVCGNRALHAIPTFFIS